MSIERYAEGFGPPTVGIEGMQSVRADRSPGLAGAASNRNEYARLKALIKAEGLLAKQPAYYTYKIISTLGLLALSLTILATVDSLWIQLLNAVFLAFVFTQIGFIGHDAGHQQIFSSPRKNDIILLAISFLIALNRSWWLNKHNRHHSNPNDLDLDLDINLPLLAFTPEQALSKKGLYKFVVKHQAFFYFPMMALEALSLRLDGLQYLLKNKVKYPVAEPLLMLAHFPVYLGLLFYFLSPGHAALFILVHQVCLGLYMSSVFAPNHKGMTIIDSQQSRDQMGFLRRQVLTARNLKANLFIDLWFGGLNYQIEHHLFPNMPRNKLGASQKLVKAFCYAHAIPYCETGVLQSQREILRFLHQASAPLRHRSGK